METIEEFQLVSEEMQEAYNEFQGLPKKKREGGVKA